MSTTSDIGSRLVTSLTNSSFDITNMAKVIAEAQVAGPKAILQRNVEKVTTELDALKYLQGNLQAFQTYVTDLASPDLFASRLASSSNDSVLSVSATDSAAVGSYQVESVQLAQSHTLVSNVAYTSPSDTITSGTLDISVGGAAVGSIVVDASNNTLEGLQKTINSGDYGVTASIINNGGSYQLMFTSKTSGAEGAVNLSGTTDFTMANMTTTATAQDAVMVLNGLTITNSSNTFSDVIDGVEFTLHSATPGSQQTVNVGQDNEAVTETIKSFVDVYNQLDQILDELASYDAKDLTEEELASEEYQYYGDLAGSSLLRAVRDQIQGSMSGAIAELDSNFSSLALIGITLDREGKMNIDESVLSDVVNNNMQALSSLMSKGGVSDDPLINVLGGTERTSTGNYTIDITQLADRATVVGGASTSVSGVLADQVTDLNASLVIGAGASFDIDLGGVTSNPITLTAGTYATNDDVALEIQNQINADANLAGAAQSVTVSFNSAQSRFEITSATGAVTMNNVTNLSDQGFSSASYTGVNVVDLSAGASFDMVVDDAPLTNISIAAGSYTMDELALAIERGVNKNTDIAAAGGSISVSHDGSAFSVYSDRYGGFSNLQMTNFVGFANAGFTADLTDVGQSVDGTITTATGALNLGAYADPEDGRMINISDYAGIAGQPAEVRGLSFEVLGGVTGARGTITFAQGFASRINETIDDLFEPDFGLISQRMDGLLDKADRYDDKNKKLDARFERLEMQYRMQFAMLQSIMSNAEATRNQLMAQFGNNDN
ncbi:flagellar filament capping protein FliD [Thiomicrorhabdus sediminis]|uniref:Flagellar hook-associated protein 2 n=1 Tax=Thiomicrorhabdus sediminis TaxID=2580412 RepID=A0A4P9K7M6_9GAMM|nr:flagellar filament capping protein FliD [Thiomicrorhabdus sediminis]QCU90460.1 flagellar hook-associated 2-like protein [Thiomicrorhabdus sediminis]